VTQVGRSMLLGVSCTVIPRCWAQRPQILGALTSTHTTDLEWPSLYEICVVCERVYRGKPCPTSHSVGAPESPISVTCLYAYTVWPKTSKFGMVTRVGRPLFLVVTPLSPIPWAELKRLRKLRDLLHGRSQCEKQ